jgi:hypothetical protein
MSTLPSMEHLLFFCGPPPFCVAFFTYFRRLETKKKIIKRQERVSETEEVEVGSGGRRYGYV